MTATGMRALTPTRPYPPRYRRKGGFVVQMLTTTDPKTLGLMYLVTAFAFFLAGGLMAMLIRAELAVPGLQFLSNEQYNQLFTMHGTIMLLLYATPIVFGFANYIHPAPADRRSRCGVSAAECVLLLGVPVRRAHRLRWVHHAWRRRRLRVDRLLAADFVRGCRSGVFMTQSGGCPHGEPRPSFG